MTHILLNLFVISSLLSQTVNFSIERINQKITIDGHVTESEWSGLKPLPLTMGSPTFRGQFTEKTELFVAYDDHYFYAAARMYDSDVSGIRINSLTRDSWGNDDAFAIILDTYNDNQNALAFITTPTGVRIDWDVFADAESDEGEPMNSSWNTLWDSEAITTDEGWFAEIRIPLSSLKFATIDNQVTMGLLAFRYIARKNEAHNFPAVSPDYAFGFMKPSIAHKIILHNVQSVTPIYVKPYILAGLNQEFNENIDKSAYIQESDGIAELGLDVKYNLSNQLTLDVSLNTDFAQVESDDAQVNLSQFDLYRPEKRLFFQERASLFDFSLAGPTRLFYSRQIGFSDTGAVRILGGARLTGRISEWDIGMINMQTEKSILLPSENFGVFRFKKGFINKNSFFGGLITTRLGNNGDYNIAIGLDNEIRFGDSDNYFSMNIAHTIDNDPSWRQGDFIDRSRARFNLKSKKNAGIAYEVFFLYSGEFFNPEMGYLTSENYSSGGASLSYTWIHDEQSTLFTKKIGLFDYSEFNNVTGLLQQQFAFLNFNLSFKSTAGLYAQLTLEKQRLDEELELPEDNVVPIGFYKFYNMNINYNSPYGDLLSYFLSARFGEFYDGNLLSVSVNPIWSASKHLELSLTFEYNQAKFNQRNESFTSQVLRLRSRYAFSRVVSASSFIQYNSADNQVSLNARLRINPSEGNDFYLVYDEAFNTNRLREVPFLPPTQNRTVLLKYDYTLTY